jgi:hypothetical protein
MSTINCSSGEAGSSCDASHGAQSDRLHQRDERTSCFSNRKLKVTSTMRIRKMTILL